MLWFVCDSFPAAETAYNMTSTLYRLFLVIASALLTASSAQEPVQSTVLCTLSTQSSTIIQCAANQFIYIAKLNVTYTWLTCGSVYETECHWTALDQTSPFYRLITGSCLNKQSCVVNSLELIETFPPCGNQNWTIRDTVNVTWMCSNEWVVTTTPAVTTTTTTSSSATSAQTTGTSKCSGEACDAPTAQSSGDDQGLTNTEIIIIAVAACLFVLLVIVAIILAVKIYQFRKIKLDVMNEGLATS